MPKIATSAKKTKEGHGMGAMAVLALAGLLGALAAIPPAGAQAGGSATGAHWDTYCPPARSLENIAAVISASEVVACSHIPDKIPRNAQAIYGDINVAGPDIATAGLGGFTVATTGFTECTYGNQVITTDLLTTGTGATITFTITVPLTIDWCDGSILLTVTAGLIPVTLAHFAFSVGIARENNFSLNFQCGSTGTTPLAFDVATTTCGTPFSRFAHCDATMSTTVPIPATECTTPDIDIASWPPLQTDAQSKVAGAVQFSANGPTLEAPATGAIAVPLLVQALAPPTLTTGTSITFGPLVDSVVGGNGICTVGSAFTANSGTLIDGSKMFQHVRTVTFDADYCHISGTATLLTTTASAGQTLFDWHIVRPSQKLSGSLAVSGGLTLSGIPDTQEEIQAIADALAAGLEVTICPEAQPCYHILSGALDTNSTFSIGEFNQNNTFAEDVNVHFPEDEESGSPGFDRLGYLVFWIVLLAVFARLAWWFALGAAIPGFLDAVLPDLFAAYPDLTVELFLTLCLLGFCLEAAASRFSWGYYRRRPRGE